MFNLQNLNIKTVDFICLLSPLGNVKKILSDGNKFLIEIEFHKNLIDSNENSDSIIIDTDEYIGNSIMKIYKHENEYFIINKNTGIIEIPNNFDENHYYFQKINGEKNKKILSKFIRKNFPKDCHNILKKGINLKKCNDKVIDPLQINLSNLQGYKTISL